MAWSGKPRPLGSFHPAHLASDWLVRSFAIIVRSLVRELDAAAAKTIEADGDHAPVSADAIVKLAPKSIRLAMNKSSASIAPWLPTPSEDTLRWCRRSEIAFVAMREQAGSCQFPSSPETSWIPSAQNEVSRAGMHLLRRFLLSDLRQDDKKEQSKQRALSRFIAMNSPDP